MCSVSRAALLRDDSLGHVSALCEASREIRKTSDFETEVMKRPFKYALEKLSQSVTSAEAEVASLSNAKGFFYFLKSKAEVKADLAAKAAAIEHFETVNDAYNRAVAVWRLMGRPVVDNSKPRCTDVHCGCKSFAITA